FTCLLSFFFLLIPRLPQSTLFPYTTLFRSRLRAHRQWTTSESSSTAVHRGSPPHASVPSPPQPRGRMAGAWRSKRRSTRSAGWRSEEHTSELQSPCNLVCRLLLEKKKKK